MSLPVGVVTTQDLTAAFTAVETAFNQFKFDETLIASKVAFISNGKGKKVQHMLSYSGGMEEDWPLGTDRKKISPLIYQCEVTNERIAPPDTEVYMATLDWDRYQILSGDLAKFTSRSKRIWDRRLAKMIKDNPVGYDGVSLFNALHPANPNDLALGTYSNDITGADLDEAGLTAALTAMEQMKWLDGNLMALPKEDLVLLVPNAQLELKARKLIFGTLTPQAGTAAGTSVAASNVVPGLSGIVRDVVCLPELIDPAVAATQKRWYLVNASQVAFRPFIVNVVHWPLFHYSGMSPNDYVRVVRGAVSYGYEANGGVAPGVPQTVIRATAP